MFGQMKLFSRRQLLEVLVPRAGERGKKDKVLEAAAAVEKQALTKGHSGMHKKMVKNKSATQLRKFALKGKMSFLMKVQAAMAGKDSV